MDEIKQKIYEALKNVRREKPISRVELVRLVGERERTIRRKIAEECPDIGSVEGGYYLCVTRRDWEIARAELKSRVKKLCERIRRSEVAEQSEEQGMML